MSVISVTANDQALTLTETPTIASGGINEDYVLFSFDSSWDGFTKTASFYRDDDMTVYPSTVGNDGKALIPAEVIARPGRIYFGVCGTKNSITKTSEVIWYRIRQGCRSA